MLTVCLQRAEVALDKMSGRAVELQDSMTRQQGEEIDAVFAIQDAHTR